MELKGKVIDFLGDSITEGHGTSAPDKCFHQLIKEKYELEWAYNCGIGGTRIARQTNPTIYEPKFDLTFEIRSQAMDKNADAVVVFGATNDYGHGDAHFGTDDSEDIYTFCGAVNSLIKSLKANFPKAEIVFMTPLHRVGEETPSEPDGKTLKDYSDAVNRICAKHNVTVIDLFKINPIDPYNTALVPDGLHPNDDGHKILAEVVAEALLKI